jgi:phage/plasmid-like protein (TIGR03299 family)
MSYLGAMLTPLNRTTRSPLNHNLEEQMSHMWDSGFMVREPSWHKMENAVLPDGVLDWDDARKHAGLTFEIGTEPVYVADLAEPDVDLPELYRLKGWQAIYRDDKAMAEPEKRYLAVQPSSYHVIHNHEFGEVINTVIGAESDDPIAFESLMSLYGGRAIVALVYFQKPLELPFDQGPTYRFLALRSRHDGEGGLRGIPTNVRIQCANTLKQAEMTDGRRVGFTIRHTANWKERLEEIRQLITASRGEGEQWEKFARDLEAWKVGTRQREAFLKKFLPIDDAMSKVTMSNAENARHDIRRILESPTCDGISKSGYGLLMGATEWSDHVRKHRSNSSYVTRQMLIKEPHKARAASILRSMAGIKG